MGELDQELSLTQKYFIRIGLFYPSLRKTSKLLGLETTKYRFERGIDPNSMIDGLNIATDMIIKICGGQASKFSITGKKTIK